MLQTFQTGSGSNKQRCPSSGNAWLVHIHDWRKFWSLAFDHENPFYVKFSSMFDVGCKIFLTMKNVWQAPHLITWERTEPLLPLGKTDTLDRADKTECNNNTSSKTCSAWASLQKTWFIYLISTFILFYKMKSML